MKAKLKIVLDCLMVILLPLLMAYSLVGESIHEWLGTAMSLLFIGHHVLNRTWYCGLRKGRWNAARVFQTAVNFALLLTMLGLMASGVMLSRYVFSALPVHGGRSFARTLHMLSAYWGLCFMSLHLGLHWTMVLGLVRRLTGPASREQLIVLRVTAVLLAGYGVFAFVRRQIGTYMLLRNIFVFFDFDETRVFFFLDYLAVMGLFIFIGYYLQKAVRQRNNFTKRFNPKV